MNGKKFTINIIANSILRSDILSGGDRIFIECGKRWAKSGNTINIFTCEEGTDMCKRYGLHYLENINFFVWSSSRFNKFGLIPLYILRTINACISIMKMPQKSENVIIFSSSDFWPDSIPGFFMCRKIKGSKWVAAFYLFAPSPFSKESPYRGGKFLRGLLYRLSQIPIYWLVKKYADMVWVTSELYKSKFINGKKLASNKVVVIRWGVDIKTPLLIPELIEKKFDAVFIGRFHPQKGVLELIDIWKYVCDRIPNAKLAMIGTGELESDVREKIRKLGLEKNIAMLGFKDGIEKLKIFKESKIVIHPAIYDTGAIAPMEAMACGLPGIFFDLPALKTYYPKGVIRIPCYNLKKFAKTIVDLLTDTRLYCTLREEAINLTKELDWDVKAEELLNVVRGILR